VILTVIDGKKNFEIFFSSKKSLINEGYFDGYKLNYYVEGA
jgi:hypothetical protein